MSAKEGTFHKAHPLCKVLVSFEPHNQEGSRLRFSTKCSSSTLQKKHTVWYSFHVGVCLEHTVETHSHKYLETVQQSFLPIIPSKAEHTKNITFERQYLPVLTGHISCGNNHSTKDGDVPMNKGNSQFLRLRNVERVTLKLKVSVVAATFPVWPWRHLFQMKHRRGVETLRTMDNSKDYPPAKSCGLRSSHAEQWQFFQNKMRSTWNSKDGWVLYASVSKPTTQICLILVKFACQMVHCQSVTTKHIKFCLRSTCLIFFICEGHGMRAVVHFTTAKRKCHSNTHFKSIPCTELGKTGRWIRSHSFSWRWPRGKLLLDRTHRYHPFTTHTEFI